MLGEQTPPEQHSQRGPFGNPPCGRLPRLQTTFEQRAGAPRLSGWPQQRSPLRHWLMFVHSLPSSRVPTHFPFSQARLEQHSSVLEQVSPASAQTLPPPVSVDSQSPVLGLQVWPLGQVFARHCPSLQTSHFVQPEQSPGLT